jgi:hypothetical protein
MDQPSKPEKLPLYLPQTIQLLQILQKCREPLPPQLWIRVTSETPVWLLEHLTTMNYLYFNSSFSSYRLCLSARLSFLMALLLATAIAAEVGTTPDNSGIPKGDWLESVSITREQQTYSCRVCQITLLIAAISLPVKFDGDRCLNGVEVILYFGFAEVPLWPWVCSLGRWTLDSKSKLNIVSELVSLMSLGASFRL